MSLSIEQTSRKGILMTLQIIDNQPKRRDRLIIIGEIINITRKGSSKTQIMFKANLSFSQLNQYLSLLLNKALLEKKALNGKFVYLPTTKGLEFLQRQQQVIDLLYENDNVPRRNAKWYTYATPFSGKTSLQ
jgi:predicted transcriptional regulator